MLSVAESLGNVVCASDIRGWLPDRAPPPQRVAYMGTLLGAKLVDLDVGHESPGSIRGSGCLLPGPSTVPQFLIPPNPLDTRAAIASLDSSGTGALDDGVSGRWMIC